MQELARRGFALGAESYGRGRASYPLAALDWLQGEWQLGEAAAVLDLAAGTGKLTAQLRRFSRVVAVEPIAEMRAQLSSLAGVEVRPGTAEAIPLADEEVDAVFIAQAFHWFATAEALAEIHRVLKPGGKLALLWNLWDRRVAWVAALKSLTAPYDARRPNYESGAWRAAFAAQAQFDPLRSAEFDNPSQLTPETLAERIASTSTVAVLPDAERTELLARVRSLLATHPQTAGKGELAVPYRTEVHWTVRLPP